MHCYKSRFLKLIVFSLRQWLTNDLVNFHFISLIISRNTASFAYYFSKSEVCNYQNKIHSILYFSLQISVEIILFSDNNCGGVLTALDGTIKSPNFPAPYPDNSYCKWHIVAKAKMNWRIIFFYFNLPFEDEIWNNYLQIETHNRGDYQNFSGGRGPALLETYFFSSDNILEIEFRTVRNEKQNYGFWLSYSAYNSRAKAATSNAKSMLV